MVGAVLVKDGRIIGRGWHHRAGEPHAEVEALLDAHRRGRRTAGATLYVSLEPCCTTGRTPRCTDAIVEAGIKRVVAGATDPNPRHHGRGFALLRKAGVSVTQGVLAEDCARLNEPFNHWIQHRTPYVTVKAAMTLDGKIATASGESKWITGRQARDHAMRLRRGADAILVGINTVLADDPSLTVRPARKGAGVAAAPRLRRIILDACARTPLTARVVSDPWPNLTTIVVGRAAPRARADALAKRVGVMRVPSRGGLISLRWLLRKLGGERVTHLLVEGGGEVNASFLLGGLAQRIAFYYAPKVLGGRTSRKSVAGLGARKLAQAYRLTDLEWRRVGADWLLDARVAGGRKSAARK